MISLLLLVILMGLLQFRIIYNFYNKQNKKLPPGPTSLPIIGNIHNIGLDIKAAFQKWRVQYGDLVGFQLGGQPAVVISDFETLKKAFKEDKISGRPKAIKEIFHAFFQKDESDKSDGGIVFGDGQQWKEQRRFALKTLRDLGFGKSSMQSVMSEEVGKLVEELRCLTGKPTVLAHRTNLAVVNSLWQILNGERSEMKNPKMKQVFRGTTEFIKTNSLAGPLMVFPRLRHLPILKGLFNKSRQFPQEMREVTSETIQNHFDTYEGEHQRDFIDHYIKKINETEDPNSSFYGKKGAANMQRTIMDLFGAGSETTSSILCFTFLYLTRWPEVQKKVQEEIDTMIGSRTPILEDRQFMPYTEAVIQEVLRLSCLVYTVPHATSDDVEIAGHMIPSGTAVYANVWWIHNDPSYWNKPEQFNPERFIQDGKFVKDDHCIPFMIGKRYCPGQSLAMHQLFLFLTGLLQSFSFLAPGGDCTKVNTEPRVGFIHSCPEYQVVLEERK